MSFLYKPAPSPRRGARQPFLLSIVLALLPAAAAAQVVYPGMKSGVVKILAEKPDGRDTSAGLVVGVDGNVALILTANHVIEDASEIEVKFFDKPYIGFAAIPFERFQQDLDIAVLVVAPDDGRRIPEGLPTFNVGDAAALAVLDKISAIGHPLDVEWQISLSTVAQIGHEDDMRKIRFTKSDVAPGNSGGPIFDEGGNVIGMVIEAAPLHGIGVKIDDILLLLESWRISTSQLVPRAAHGALLVSSDPPGAEIFLDSEPVGSTAAGALTLRELEPGAYTLRATLAGYGAWEETVDVEADRERSIVTRLQAITAGLRVRSQPPGAEVFLDSRPVGATASGALALAEVEPGRHTLRLEKAGHRAWEETVDVEAGRERSVEAVLRPVAGSLRVETRPPGATIALAGRVVGSTASGPLTLEGLEAGRYALSATREGFEAWHTEVEIQAAQASHVLAEMWVVEKPSIEAYLVLYKEGNFNGPSLKIRFDAGSRVDIGRGHSLFDAAASIELFAPPNVEVMLAEHTLGFERYPGATGRWRGNGARVRIDKRELAGLGLKNAISSISWYVDGKAPDNRTAVVN